jgi:hypothetical protein
MLIGNSGRYRNAEPIEDSMIELRLTCRLDGTALFRTKFSSAELLITQLFQFRGSLRH